jgi:hypothetical protein
MVSKALSEKMMEGSFKIYTLSDKRYINDPTFSRIYPMKSNKCCLFDAVQYVSTIFIFCMHLQILIQCTQRTFYQCTRYILLCFVIDVAFNPACHCQPAICIPRK